MHIVPQRRRPALGVHDVARVAVQLRHPPRHLVRVGERRREQHVARAVRQQDEGLLDGPAARCAAEHVHLVEDDPLDLAHQSRAGEDLQPQYLGGHDEAARVLVDGDVARDEADVAEEQLQLAVLLVGQRLDRRRVDHALAVPERRGDGVLGTDGLPRRGVGGHQDRLAAFDARARGSLEAVEPEWKLASWEVGPLFGEQRSLAFCWCRHLADRQLLRRGRKARRHGHAVLEGLVHARGERVAPCVGDEQGSAAHSASSHVYVGRLHNGTRPEVRHMRDARLEAGRLQRMRHARAQVPHELLFYLRAGGVPTRHTQGRPR